MSCALVALCSVTVIGAWLKFGHYHQSVAKSARKDFHDGEVITSTRASNQALLA